jgi:hypothetical protein
MKIKLGLTIGLLLVIMTAKAKLQETGKVH